MDHVGCLVATSDALESSDVGHFPLSISLDICPRIYSPGHHCLNILENMAIANALQIEAARHSAVPIRFTFVARANLNSLSLSVAVLERFTAYTLRYAVTLKYDPVTLTFDLERVW